MRLTSTMGAAGLLKALALALSLFGGRAVEPNAGDAAAKAARHGDGINQRVRDLVAKMVSAIKGFLIRSING